MYKLKFIDSYRFMSTSLSDFTDNLSEINEKECKACMERNNFNHNVNLSNLKLID